MFKCSNVQIFRQLKLTFTLNWGAAIAIWLHVSITGRLQGGANTETESIETCFSKHKKVRPKKKGTLTFQFIGHRSDANWIEWLFVFASPQSATIPRLIWLEMIGYEQSILLPFVEIWWLLAAWIFSNDECGSREKEGSSGWLACDPTRSFYILCLRKFSKPSRLELAASD